MSRRPVSLWMLVGLMMVAAVLLVLATGFAPPAGPPPQATEEPQKESFNVEAVLRGKEGHYGILPSGIPTANRRYKIGLSMITMAQDYTIDVVNGAKAMAEQLGVDFEVFDAAVDANKELADVETMIANKFDGIFVYATDPALGPVISKKMKDAGVVPLGADTPMTADDYYYGVPSIYGGYISGKYMMEQMKAKNWDPAETVYMFADLSAFPACTMRLEGYKKALDEYYPDFPKENIVWYDVPYSLEESLKSIQDTITAHPAKNYLYAVACGDQMAAGGARALEAAGYTSDNAMISGQGGGIGPREELKKPGSLYISYTGYMGTCAGKLAVNFMVRLLNGEKDLPQNVQQKVVLLTKDTVDQYYPGGVELCTDEDVRGLLPQQ